MEEFRCRCVSSSSSSSLLPANAIAIVIIIPIRPRGFFSSRFQSPLSSASGFFNCGSQLLPQLLPQLPSFSIAFLVLNNSGQVRAVFRLPTPTHLSTHGDSCALMACRLVGEAVQTVCGHLF
jgi:hypothetical protein